ncbi:Trappc3 [Symbiodinium microadriaticum]|nr:Trappc3 [Symbiodinium microadriaticum]
MIAKVAFKMFLGITADVVNWTDPPAGGGGGTNGTGFSLVLAENPFAEFVELPPAYAGLHYSNILCGVIKGALEMVQLQVECRFVKDTLKGDDTNELRVELKGHLATTMSEEYSRES